MKIVIEIPEDEYNIAKYGQYGNINVDIVRKALANGTPLPKGHGRLIDVDEVIKIANKTKDLHGAIWNAQTIIEADKEE